MSFKCLRQGGYQIYGTQVRHPGGCMIIVGPCLLRTFGIRVGVIPRTKNTSARMIHPTEKSSTRSLPMTGLKEPKHVKKKESCSTISTGRPSGDVVTPVGFIASALSWLS
ncbi:unnamed protein product [Phytophthora lilii]|uniref:Unnamed protein product n=1 Tax=Phytophthora lilii TaxID=2077276 RepID=A0A9W6TA48_9STRA|nr:unnamed protein product [Phytophthora lilii]